MRIRVLHVPYGCDTGCCGHVIEVDEVEGRFEFTHPPSNVEVEKRAWAQDWIREKFGEEHVKDLDWENSEVLDD